MKEGEIKKKTPSLILFQVSFDQAKILARRVLV